MDTVKDILEWVGYILAFIGFLATAYKSIEIWARLSRLSWGDIDKYSKVIIKKIADDRYVPDIIVGIGRGGSILASILSGNITVPGNKAKNIPFLGIDRMYEWQNGSRVEIENSLIDLSPLAGKKVLLVAGDILTGGTIKFYVHQIEKIDIAKLKTACLVKGVSSTFQPDYFGKEILADFHMPWMYKGYGYIRDSRHPIVNKNQTRKMI